VGSAIVDIDRLRAVRAAGADLRGAVLVGLDLTAPEDDRLLRTALDGALLLGCRLTPASRARADAAGVLLFPDIPDLPYHVYRSTLYTPDELFAGFDPERPESYADTVDARVYRDVMAGGADPGPVVALSRRLHDHGIAEALRDVLAKAGPPVAVMGGHQLARDSPGYRSAVELGRALGRSGTGFTVLTGGGPGAMEAVPLGVRLSEQDDTATAAALRALAAAPGFGGSIVDDVAIGRWLAAAGRVELPREETPRTIGIPTWFYGHEPPNRFVSWHAKYFANSVREDGLLSVATGGVVYTPGSAGTVQEVFQDYTQNHYGSIGPPAPMVFLGKDFWLNDVPAAPLVQQLAKGRPTERWILVTDDRDEAVALLEDYAAQAAGGR
jgi:predicted Rossmann-fold nucleotide-binding protein